MQPNTQAKVCPPKLKRKVGRLRERRKRQEGEAAPSTAKRSSTVRCAFCKQLGHNKRTCEKAPPAAAKGQKQTTSVRDGGGSGSCCVEGAAGSVLQQISIWNEFFC
ncbi:hypothetical protein JCGZ_24215 [Jatropha curcas]|uniref:CCHC-type domain-containing protein n=1 Tax=Jatropha curcas TaxID=180498 RepID=A0A067LGL1_JATCU|nr:hypothetical protein JCGZ_24215 [Jatropha curcas]